MARSSCSLPISSFVRLLYDDNAGHALVNVAMIRVRPWHTEHAARVPARIACVAVPDVRHGGWRGVPDHVVRDRMPRELHGVTRRNGIRRRLEHERGVSIDNHGVDAAGSRAAAARRGEGSAGDDREVKQRSRDLHEAICYPREISPDPIW